MVSQNCNLKIDTYLFFVAAREVNFACGITKPVLSYAEAAAASQKSADTIAAKHRGHRIPNIITVETYNTKCKM